MWICYCYAVDQRYYTANVHLLVHIADSVRCLGPLWTHSAFPFEDTNGWLADRVQGARYPDKQVFNIAVLCRTLTK